jgi:gliding motility-associated-like protein
MGEEVMFTAVANPAGFPGIYLWRIDGVEVQRGQNSTYTTSTMMDGQAVTCELITSGGCILNNPAYSNAVVMVVNELPMYFPNSFRPGSAIPENQVFRPKTLLDNIVKYELLIYDRWGQKIFATNKLDKGWDGKQNGEECPVGVYVYVANYELQGNEVKAGETYTKKGNVILLK